MAPRSGRPYPLAARLVASAVTLLIPGPAATSFTLLGRIRRTEPQAAPTCRRPHAAHVVEAPRDSRACLKTFVARFHSRNRATQACDLRSYGAPKGIRILVVLVLVGACWYSRAAASPNRYQRVPTVTMYLGNKSGNNSGTINAACCDSYQRRTGAARTTSPERSTRTRTCASVAVASRHQARQVVTAPDACGKPGAIHEKRRATLCGSNLEPESIGRRWD